MFPENRSQAFCTGIKRCGAESLSPGGGAEVLSEYVRKRISPKKNPNDGWITVHREAHKLGFKSTATMMYGHVDRPEDWVEHFNRVRDLQDETGGFTAFIPWSFKPGNSALEKKVPVGKGPNTYLRMLAASRVYLDNIPHIQASWFSEGKKVGQISLHFGADDFGGTLIDENVLEATVPHQYDNDAISRNTNDSRSRLHASPAHNALRYSSGV